MGTARLLWIDLCHRPQPDGLIRALPGDCAAMRVVRVDAIRAAVDAHDPRFLCIEYDYPDRARLQAIHLVRRAFPSLPVLMFTQYHSEALAVWALRSRVWDYRVKPISAGVLSRSVEAAARHAEPMGSGGPWADPFPPDLAMPAGHIRGPLTLGRRTDAAVAYITESFDKKITIEVLAELCRLSLSEFSRAFHREQGITCRRFLLQYRVARARDLLTELDAPVSQVAYAVGFNDLSHFARAFRSIVGVPASEFQRRQHCTQRASGQSARLADSFQTRADWF